MEVLNQISTGTGLKVSSNEEINQLLKLIAVKPPYFALSNIERKGEYLQATVPLEQTEHNEPDGMCTAEVGRHLAILGSLAVADGNPRKEKHYYLASEATLERVTDQPVSDTRFIGRVRLESINKRVAEISGQLITEEGLLLYQVTVKYAIMHERIFERMFGHERRVNINIPAKNPYRVKTKLFNIQHGLKSCHASLGRIKEDDCAGHFYNYPAVPIARLGFALSQLAGEHLHTIRNTSGNYYMYKVKIKAQSFIFAGEKIDMYSRVGEQQEENGLLIETTSTTNSCSNAVELSCWFK